MKREHKNFNPDRPAAAFLLATFLLAGTAPMSVSHASNPKWQPTITERLVRLPANHMKRAVEKDFAKSPLATAIGETSDKLTQKSNTIGDLKDAAARATGELKTEFRHQTLMEKQALVRLMGDRVELKRKHLNTKARLYKRLLRKVKFRPNKADRSSNELAEKFETASKRFNRTVTQVDMSMFGNSLGEESKYNRDYRKNLAAIETLVNSIKAHPMNQLPEIDGNIIGKEDYLRQLISSTESELAILDQEENILGYMAKLIALDAMALSEGLTDPLDNEFQMAADDPQDVSNIIKLFTQ